MNLPNIITLSRIPLLFLIVLLLHVPFKCTASAAFVVYIIAALTDWLDGYVARKKHEISNFGKLIDALTDKILILGIYVSLLALTIIPGWSTFLVLMILIREFLISGLRAVAASQGIIIAAERWGKQKTIIQLISLGILLFYNMLQSDLSFFFSAGFIYFFYFAGMITFCTAAFMTVLSGVNYLVKYRRVLRKEMKS